MHTVQTSMTSSSCSIVCSVTRHLFLNPSLQWNVEIRNYVKLTPITANGMDNNTLQRKIECAWWQHSERKDTT